MTDDETWVDADHANTLNAFDVGDTRTTHAIVNALDRQAGGPDDNSAQAGHLIPQIASTLQGSSKGSRGWRNDAEGMAGGHIVPVAIPLQDGRAIAKNQNGLGIGVEGDPAYTLDRTGAQSVAHAGGHLIPFDTNFSNQASPGGSTSPTLDTRGTHGVAHVSPTLTRHNLDSRSPQSEEQQRIVGAVHEAQMTVRRLTPIECERLMGWPDGWTAPEGVKASDSKRYAACGDGIVAPVAFWIADRIRMIEEEEEVS